MKACKHLGAESYPLSIPFRSFCDTRQDLSSYLTSICSVYLILMFIQPTVTPPIYAFKLLISAMNALK